MCHVLAIVAVFLLGANHLVICFHTIICPTDLRRVVMETVVHVLHGHIIHVVRASLDLWQLLVVTSLVTVRVARVADVVSALRRHGTLLVVAHLQVWQLLLRLHRLLFRRVDV